MIASWTGGSKGRPLASTAPRPPFSALESQREQEFDSILLDVHMPVLDGKETIKRIRASGEPWAKLPVMALTADAMSGDRERFLEMGMDDYISKPIDARELATKFVGLLQGARPWKSAAA